MEEFTIPSEGGINEQCKKIVQNPSIIIHNEKNPLIRNRKKAFEIYYSSDSILKLKKETSKSNLKQVKPTNSKLQVSFGDNSFFDNPELEEEKIVQNSTNYKLSTFGRKNLQIKEIEALAESNEEKNEISIKPKRLEDFPKSQKMEIIKSFDRMIDLPKLEDKLFTDFYLYLDEQINSNKKTLLLDLDETLIYSLSDHEPYDKNRLKDLKVTFFNGGKKMRFLKRPFLQEFLEFTSKFFEILIYTSSTKDYSSAIIQKLDPNHKYISKILSRSQCFLVNKTLIKDIRILRNREPENIIIIDNNIVSFYSCLNNGIYIESFYGNPEDKNLCEMMTFLEKAHSVKDVRIEIIKTFGLNKIYENYVRKIETMKNRNKSSKRIPQLKFSKMGIY